MRGTVDFARLLTAAVILLLLTLSGCGGSDDAGLPPEDPAAAGEAVDPWRVDPDEPQPTLEELNRVVAEVNGAPIVARRVNEVAEINKAQIEAEGRTLTEEDEQRLRLTALNLIIDAELMLQAARKEGLSVDPRRLDEQVQQARAKFDSEQDYRNYLARAQLTEEEVRQEAERQLLVQQFMQKLTGDVTVEEAVARKLYEQNKDRFTEGEQVHAAYILVKTSPDDPPARRDDARKRIDEAHRRIQDGEDFAQIAREYSQAPNAAKGGDVGFFPRGAMVPKFEELAFTTEIGKVTPVFETPFGFNILKVLDRREATPIPFEEVKPTLMLMAARQQESRVVQERLAALRKTAKIAILDETLKPAPPAPAEDAAAEG